MRILQLHSNFIEYEAIEKEIPSAEELEKTKDRIEEVVVLFTAVEEGDDLNVAKKAMESTKVSLDQLKVNRVLIYPYAHLSSNLAKPSEALKVLNELKNVAKEMGIETYSSPFGWCKQFSISIKGHPLAEHLRVVTCDSEKEEVVCDALKAEEKLKSYWYVLQPDGELIPVKEYRFKDWKNLEKLCKYEIKKVRAEQNVPPHVPLMKRLEIADYEPGSDPGNLRWYPKGRMIKSLIEQYVTEKVIDYGGMEVETPIMYDLEHPAIAHYLQRFPARQYVLCSDKRDFFLRFSACFGQFLMVHDTQFSYKQLPLRMYELTKYAFRREKSGEVTGLRRLRCFTMPDCHALVADMDQAKEEFLVRFQMSMGIMDSLELNKETDYELAIRVTKDFYAENKDFVLNMVKLFGKPVLIEMWEERFFYFVLKWEFNFVDNLNKASALSTDQIDIENSKHYDMTYVDENGEKQYPLVLHCSPSGAIERDVYALLEKAHRDSLKGKTPILPLWLAPTQLRIIPVSEKYLDEAEKLMKKIENCNVRVDVDDRALSLGKKVRAAEKEWVNYVLVYGEKEANSEVLPVRDRNAGKQIREMRLQELTNEINEKTADKPFKPLALPKLLSKRPQFSF
ncbi:MAG: threonine--tRNA ligase [Candidatus Bathyarchaeota archaeon]|nr:threonine--tRNA ligase [Candidatus Bathyarchaeum tardum]WGM89363.1 MAG: threonine--tRNA ligase [Candidatus Bathyarchaeum tardum]WNZ28363.1 MAG: threonine--tRNA ligase [Candidatus Bathyarchaeota archaeon]